MLNAFEPGYNGLSQFKEDTGRPSMPVLGFYLSMPASPMELKTPSRPGFEPRPARALGPSGQQANVAY